MHLSADSLSADTGLNTALDSCVLIDKVEEEEREREFAGGGVGADGN